MISQRCWIGSLSLQLQLCRGSGIAFCDSLAIKPNRASAAGSARCHCKTVTTILFDTTVTRPFPSDLPSLVFARMEYVVPGDCEYAFLRSMECFCSSPGSILK